MKQYGCIGKKLPHSFSREIHRRLADYTYDLIELEEAEVGGFLTRRDFAAINVTIPYKETVIPYLDEISSVAERIGAVNTVVNREGRLYGYTTDDSGLFALLVRLGLELTGTKVLVLGTGGTAKTAHAVASDRGARLILTVSRSRREGCITYEDAAALHTDADVIINATPSGMYPDCEGAPLSLAPFTALSGVVDAVYNPLRTRLVLEAQARGIPAEGGLYMLVMQAVYAVEHFLSAPVEREKAEEVFASLLSAKENVVLVGMPGCGKSTVGRLLLPEGFAFYDTDEEITRRYGHTPAELIETRGEACFRDLESRVVADLSTQGGRVIATGGGAVLRADNVRRLKQNGRLFYLDAPLSRLVATEDRPLSDTADKLARLYSQRLDVYRAAADVTVPDLATPEAEAAYILTKRRELLR